MHLRPSPFRPWQPLSDAEWHVLSAFVLNPRGGRPRVDYRARLDGIFQACTAGISWARVSDAHGQPDRLRRQFHRWASQGLFDVLLHAARDPVSPSAGVLRGMEHWLCCAYRRAIPVAGTTMAEVLGYGTALRPVDRARGPSTVSGQLIKLLKSLETAQVLPAPRPPAPRMAFRLTSPAVAAIRRPLPNTGRGRLPAQGHDHATGASAACTAPP